MLEIFAIVFLGQKISRMVKEKGLKPGKYVIIMLLLWIGLEITGAMLGAIIFGEGLAAYPLALLGAVIGAIISYQIARNAAPKLDETNDLLDANI